jgi:hypothetical protein
MHFLAFLSLAAAAAASVLVKYDAATNDDLSKFGQVNYDCWSSNDCGTTRFDAVNGNASLHFRVCNIRGRMTFISDVPIGRLRRSKRSCCRSGEFWAHLQDFRWPRDLTFTHSTRMSDSIEQVSHCRLRWSITEHRWRLSRTPHLPWRYCCGHDLLHGLQSPLGFRGKWSDCVPVQIIPQTICPIRICEHPCLTAFQRRQPRVVSADMDHCTIMRRLTKNFSYEQDTCRHPTTRCEPWQKPA